MGHHLPRSKRRSRPLAKIPIQSQRRNINQQHNLQNPHIHKPLRLLRIRHRRLRLHIRNNVAIRILNRGTNFFRHQPKRIHRERNQPKNPTRIRPSPIPMLQRHHGQYQHSKLDEQIKLRPEFPPHQQRRRSMERRKSNPKKRKLLLPISPWLGERHRRLPLTRFPSNRRTTHRPFQKRQPTLPPQKADENNQTPGRTYLMDCIAGAAADQEKGVEMGTHAKYASSWNNWLAWLAFIGADDPYLLAQTPTQKIRILCAFMHAVRRGDFNPHGHQVTGKTAETAINHVAATIVSSGGVDPRLDSTGSTSLILKRQTRSYKKVDPTAKHQKPIPPEVFRYILRRSDEHPRKRARAELVCANLFFASRSCEYSKTQQHHKKTTRTIRPVDVEFRYNGRLMRHSDPHLHLAHHVIITFGPQKADIHRDEKIPHENTNDRELNPVAHWAYIIRRLKSYPGYEPTWPIYTYYNFKTKRFSDIRSSEILIDIRSAVEAFGYEVLGIHPHEVGTHSVRRSFAMMNYLAGTSPFTIMKIGRWASDSFLLYIEKSVLTFSQGVSTKMLCSNTFFNIPLKAPNNKQNKIQPGSPTVFGPRSPSRLERPRPPVWPICCVG